MPNIVKLNVNLGRLRELVKQSRDYILFKKSWFANNCCNSLALKCI